MEWSGIGLFSTYTYSYVLENIVLLKRVFLVKINLDIVSFGNSGLYLIYLLSVIEIFVNENWIINFDVGNFFKNLLPFECAAWAYYHIENLLWFQVPPVVKIIRSILLILFFLSASIVSGKLMKITRPYTWIANDEYFNNLKSWYYFQFSLS